MSSPDAAILAQLSVICSPLLGPATSDNRGEAAADNRQPITDNCGEAAPPISASQRFSFSAFSTSAFTLVELMVVITVIVILMALLAPAFTNLKSAGDVTG